MTTLTSLLNFDSEAYWNNMPRIKTKKRSKKTYKKKYNYLKKKARTYKRSYKKARGNSWSSIGRSAIKYGLPLLKGIKTISGFGNYSGGMSGTQVPVVQNTAGGCIVRHREYIGDLQSSQGFLNSAYYINPGNSTLFPWLAGVANNFEEWVPRGMVFEFKTTSSDTVVNTSSGSPALGSVIMATDYNVYNAQFGSKQQMENYEFAVSCKPSCSMIHQIETKKTENPLPTYYVYNGSPSVTMPSTLPVGDARMYFPGLFQIATVGNTINSTANASNNLGELWCSYEMEFKKPRILPGTASPQQNPAAFDHFKLQATAILSTIAPATPFGTSSAQLILSTTSRTLGGLLSGASVPTTNQTIGLSVFNSSGQNVASTANTYYFPPQVTSGNFMLVYNAYYTNAGTSTGALSVTTVSAAQTLNLSQNNTTNTWEQVNTGASTSQSWTVFYTVTGPNASLTIVDSGSMTSATYADLYVIQLPNVVN